MEKIIKDKTIYFYDNDKEIMYIDYSVDECIWFFNSNEPVLITENMELYNPLNTLMKQSYVFDNEYLKNYKDENKLVWYSDQFFDPDDEWTLEKISSLNIERRNNGFYIWCDKKLDKRINRPRKTHTISFSPGGNGRYSKNLNTNLSLQDDFVILVYQKLLTKNKILKKQYYK